MLISLLYNSKGEMSMKNIANNKEYEVPVKAGGEFRSLIHHLRHIFEPTNNEADMWSMEPKIDFSETKEAVNISAEIPGIDEEDLEVQISSDGYLTISGEKKQQIEHNKKDNYFSEISYGMFQRTVPLPWDLDYSKAEAEYTDGMLNIKIPKTAIEKMKTKKLPVKKKKAVQKTVETTQKQ